MSETKFPVFSSAKKGVATLRPKQLPPVHPTARSKQGAKDPEFIALTLWWSTDQRVLENFMATAMKTMMEEESDDMLDIYVRGLRYCWTQTGCN